MALKDEKDCVDKEVTPLTTHIAPTCWCLKSDKNKYTPLGGWYVGR